jgi:4-amino-4-deoxy-L-arabinose transferase-like glycosyltransferase
VTSLTVRRRLRYVPRIRFRLLMASRRHAIPFSLLLAVTLALGLLSLNRTPAPFVDEAWYANRAWAFIHTGRAFGTMDSGVLDKYDGYWTYFPVLGTLAHAAAIWTFGLSLYSVRLVSLAFGLVLLVAIFTVGHRFGGYRCGLVAASLTSVSSAFIYSSHLARHDILVSAFGFGAIALYSTDGSPAFSWRSVLCGLAIGLAMEIHPNAIIYAPVVSALYIVEHRWSLRAVLVSRRFWGFLLGLAIGIAYFWTAHLLPYPGTYMAITTAIVGTSKTPPILLMDLGAWLESIGDVMILFLLSGPLLTPLSLAGLVLASRQRTDASMSLLVLFAALAFSTAAIISNKIHYYSILVSPAADLLAAFLVDRVLAQLSPVSRRLSLAAISSSIGKSILVFGCIAASIAVSLAPMRNAPAKDFQTTLDRIAEVISPGSTVMGPQTYWFGLPPDQVYLSWEQIPFYQRYAPGATLEEAFSALRPDYFIVDKHLEQFVSEMADEQLPRNYRPLRISRAELDSYLSGNAKLVSAVETATYGDVRIYRLGWKRGPEPHRCEPHCTY